MTLAVVAAASLAAPSASGAETDAPRMRCTVTGTHGADTLRGTPRRDVICGRSGNDRLRGGGGNDVLLGGSGKDRAAGGMGADRIEGADDSDLLRGGQGEDVIEGGPSGDRLYGQPDDDEILGGGGHDLCDGGPGVDLCDGLADDRYDCSRQLQPEDFAFANCATSGPWLAYFQVNPGFLYVATEPGEIHVEVALADANAPLSFQPHPVTVDAAFDSDVGPALQTVLACAKEESFWSCEGSVSVAAGTPSQTLTLAKLVMHDDTGHFTEYAGRDICLLGMSQRPECEIPQVDVLGEVDDEPPALESFTVSPQTIDTSDHGADVQVTAELSDTAAGMEDAMILWLGSPDCSCYRGDWQMRSTGDRYHSTFTTTLHLARYSKTGDYRLGVEVSDRVGNKLSLTGQELDDAGFPDHFVQTSTDEDTTPPEIVDFDLDPQVATAANGGVVTATIHITDDLSGIRDGVRSPFGDAIHILVRHRDGGGYLSTYDATRVSGTDTDGVWELPLQVPTGSQEQWEVDVDVWDGAGNYVEMDRAQLEAAGFPATFSSE